MAIESADASAAGVGSASATGRWYAGAPGSASGSGAALGDSPRFMECVSELDCTTPLTIDRTLALVIVSAVTATDSFSNTTQIGIAIISAVSAVAALDVSDRQLALDIRAAAQALTDSMVLDDDETEVWVLNPRTGATWRYENYGFSQFLKTGRFTYGVKSDGIYLLDGDDDAGDPIRASLDFGRQGFGTTKTKRMHTAYVTNDADGNLQLRVTDDSGNAYMYPLTANQRMNTVRAQLGRGLEANFFELQLFNVDGGDFDIASIELLYDVLSRRV